MQKISETTLTVIRVERLGSSRRTTKAAAIEKSDAQMQTDAIHRPKPIGSALMNFSNRESANQAMAEILNVLRCLWHRGRSNLGATHPEHRFTFFALPKPGCAQIVVEVC